MNLRESSQVIAVSADGKNRLVEVEVSGPEGGSSLRYVVQNASGEKLNGPSEALVSDNLSEGAGKTPERIPADACRRSLKGLSEILGAHGFRGVTVHPDHCDQRDQVISVHYSLTTRNDPAWGTQGRPTLITVSEKEFRRARKSGR